jgi:valyl-tRNA synthetase
LAGSFILFFIGKEEFLSTSENTSLQQEDSGSNDFGRLSSRYDPGMVEPRQLVALEAFSKSHRASPSAPSFSMVIPPPNITGRLHMGHALNLTLQDVVARFRRMEGDDVLWIPGTDHAGIATQNVVERQLSKEGISLEKIGRDDFIKKVWEWKSSIQGGILDQIRRLGASLSWDHERFTMDPGFSKAVTKVFVSLHSEGFLYRGERMIHWCPRCLTALSDVEVTHVDQSGIMYECRYLDPSDKSQFLVVATTRPETIPGDMALAVSPDDTRYTSWIGKKVATPVGGRLIPVISDPAVDREFGTGVLKITPSHAMVDWEIAQRHGLGNFEVIDAHGRMNASSGKLSGLSREEARERVVSDLEARDLLLSKKAYPGTVGVCYRCQTIVEPRLSLQWFVKMESLAKNAIEVVKNREIRFYPEGWKNTYYDWLVNIRDWCISRQIFWGHPIPAWHCSKCQHVTVREDVPSCCERCQSPDILRDPDVLDTWFSSALWPFVTMGWPESTPDLERFYPTSLLVTGFDILFFWVARMVMMGLHLTGKVPFKDVYIHALVRDQFGQKMTKSRGNVVDPLEIMEKYGTDAFRMTLVQMASPGRDIRLATDRVEGFRNFVSKLWNAFRYIDRAAQGEPLPRELSPEDVSGIANQWILLELSRSVREMREAISSYRFDEVANTLYHFTWHQFCDWYIEATKPSLDLPENDPLRIETRRTLLYTGSVLLKMAHPIMPFVTSEIWSLFFPDEPPIGDQRFPELREERASAEQTSAGFSRVMTLVGEIRQIRSHLKISPAQEIPGVFVINEKSGSILGDNMGLVSRLAKVRPLVPVSVDLVPPGIRASVSEGFVSLDIAGLVDVRMEEARLKKEVEKIRQKKNSIAQRLASREYLDKAPPEVIEKDERAKQDAEDEENAIVSALEQVKILVERGLGNSGR